VHGLRRRTAAPRSAAAARAAAAASPRRVPLILGAHADADDAEAVDDRGGDARAPQRAAVARVIDAEAEVFMERLRSPEAMAAFSAFLNRGPAR
jgi:hypothetical protein